MNNLRCLYTENPLMKALNGLNVGGWEPNEDEFNMYRIPVAEAERFVLDPILSRKDTPTETRRRWTERGELWLPCYWCTEANGIGSRIPDRGPERYAIKGSLPLAAAIKPLFPEGFERLDYFSDAYQVRRSLAGQTPEQIWDIREAMAHPSTPEWIKGQWEKYGAIWLPTAWCEEVCDAS